MEETGSLKLSPLDAWHREHGARMVDFAGWSLPVQFTSIIKEHQAVRSAAGLFDISHMAQVLVKGRAAESWLQTLLTNDVAIPEGRGVYSFMCNESGGVLDDLFVYRLAEERFLLVMNASREAEDLEWLRARAAADVKVVPQPERGALALQGPASEGIMASAAPDAAAMSRRGAVLCHIADQNVLVSRTGYTGEDGFEVWAEQAEGIVAVWDALWQAGIDNGLVAAGLGARDTLRLEMGYPLYGHELDEQTTPLEAGYGWAVKLDKGVTFTGMEALGREREAGSTRRLAGLVLEGRAVAREDSRVFSDGHPAGTVTSGTFSPSLGKPVALAYLDSSAQGPYTVEAHGRSSAAAEVKLPFYRSS